MRILLYFLFLVTHITVLAQETDTAIVKHYLKNKKLKSEDYYIDGQLISKRTYYYGKKYYGYWVEKQNEPSPRIILLKEFYLNGILKVEGYLVNGKWHGPYKSYFENGNPACDCNYRLGEYDSTQTKRHENGNLHYVKYFKNGKIHGETFYYDDEGNLTHNFIFNEGDLTEIITFCSETKSNPEGYYMKADNGKIYVSDFNGKPMGIITLNNGEIEKIKKIKSK